METQNLDLIGLPHPFPSPYFPNHRFTRSETPLKLVQRHWQLPSIGLLRAAGCCWTLALAGGDSFCSAASRRVERLRAPISWSGIWTRTRRTRAARIRSTSITSRRVVRAEENGFDSRLLKITYSTILLEALLCLLRLIVPYVIEGFVAEKPSSFSAKVILLGPCQSRPQSLSQQFSFRCSDHVLPGKVPSPHHCA